MTNLTKKIESRQSRENPRKRQGRRSKRRLNPKRLIGTPIVTPTSKNKLIRPRHIPRRAPQRKVQKKKIPKIWWPE